MPALPAVVGAPADLQVALTRPVGVSAARTARSIVVDLKLHSAHRALCLHYPSDRPLCLLPEHYANRSRSRREKARDV